MKKVYLLLSCMDNGESNEWHQLSEHTVGVYSSLELAMQKSKEEFEIVDNHYWRSKDEAFSEDSCFYGGWTWFEIHEYTLDDMGA